MSRTHCFDSSLILICCSICINCPLQHYQLLGFCLLFVFLLERWNCHVTGMNQPCWCHGHITTNSHQLMALALVMLWPSQQVEHWWLVTHPALGVSWGSPGQRSTGCHMAREGCTPSGTHWQPDLERHTTITLSTVSLAAQQESVATFWKDIDLRIRKHCWFSRCLFS